MTLMMMMMPTTLPTTLTMLLTNAQSITVQITHIIHNIDCIEGNIKHCLQYMEMLDATLDHTNLQLQMTDAKSLIVLTAVSPLPSATILAIYSNPQPSTVTIILCHSWIHWSHLLQIQQQPSICNHQILTTTLPTPKKNLQQPSNRSFHIHQYSLATCPLANIF